MAQAVFYGDRFGTLVAQKATDVRVDRETLSFDLTEALATAQVTAVYQMTNAGAQSDLEVAFVFVRGEEKPSLTMSITADGAAVPFRAVSDAALLGPGLRAWLSAHPEVEGALRSLAARERVSPADAEPLVRIVAAAGGRCMGDCDDLVRWYRDAQDDKSTLPRDTREEWVVRAAREAIPAAVEAMTKGWSTLESRRMEWLLFHLDFAPGQSRTVTVNYKHKPTEDLAAYVNPTFTYEYLLSPAKSWAGFGPLEVTLRLPDKTRLSSSIPFRLEGDLHRAQLAALPDGELRFEVMSLRGLWFSMADPAGYWVILAAAVAIATIAVGRAAGRRWARRRPGWQRTLLHLVGSGLFAMVASTLVVVLLGAVFPAKALGFGYGGFLGSVLLVLLAAPTGIAASFVAQARAVQRGVA
jgi:hypothetical protein